MRTDLFDFDLPDERIALEPVSPRDAAGLLVVRPGGEFIDSRIAELATFLDPGDVLVVNDTKVIPARLSGTRGAARIELTLHKRAGGGRWHAFAKNAKRLTAGDRVRVSADFAAHVLEKREGGEVLVALEGDKPEAELLAAHGVMPLPPYIAGRRAPAKRDLEDYQTVYAREEGAVAAPTAGLHFTPALLDEIRVAGVAVETVTLHVGAGTFLPVKAEDTRDHVMHAEWGRIDAATADRLNAARAAGGRIVAAGTTSLRLLESAVSLEGEIQPFAGETDIFITPGYEFRAVDVLLTNFHLPRSTLFMLVSAFAGLDEMKGAYAHAIAAGYRFYSYGDATLLFRS